MNTIQKGRSEVIEVQHIFLHQYHCTFDTCVVIAVVFAGEGVDDAKAGVLVDGFGIRVLFGERENGLAVDLKV